MTQGPPARSDFRVAVGVVLYRPDLERIAAPLARLSEWRGDVLVHVNGAEPQSEVVVRLRAMAPRARLTSSTDNLGFSGGHNRLMAAAFERGAEAVVVHNPDLVLDPGAVSAMMSEAQRRGGMALLGPALQLGDPATLRPEGRIDTVGIVWTRGGRHLDKHQGQPWPPKARDPHRVAGISGACLLIPRPAYEAIVSVGGELFDEEFIAYREDAELGFRAALLGIPSIIVPEATGVHARGLRGTRRGESVEIDRLGVRNRFLIAFKYGVHRPGWLPAAVLRDVTVVLGVILRERSSLPGLSEALRLRRQVRAKGARVLAAARLSSRAATRA